MELNWFQSILLGILSGMTDILPVSAQAHRLLILKILGNGSIPLLLQLILHLATLAALYYCCNTQILRLMRAQRLARIPKRRRKRPLDTRSLMDFSLLKTTLIPTILVFFFYDRVTPLEDNLVAVAVFLFINGLILYIPQYLPGSNRDSRTMSRVDGILIGLGGAASIVPGISGIGTAVSVATVRGADKNYALNIALLMNIPVTIGFITMDVMTIIASGLGTISFGLIFNCLLAGLAAFAGVFLAIRLLRMIVANTGMSVFAFYCWGISLFTFILYLTAA